MYNEGIMKREHGEDSKQWAERVIHAMQQYNLVKNLGVEHLEARALAFGALKSLAREKVELGYSIDDIDPFGVTDFSEEDRKMIIELCEKVESERESER